MAEHRIAPPRPVDTGDVIAMWVDEAGLSLEEARRRVKEVLLIATDAGGELAGLSTAYVAVNGQLRMNLWHVRVFVREPHRRGELAVALARAARDRLRDRFVSGRDVRAAGMLFEVQHEGLRRHLDQAIWPRTGFAFIGENDRGHHVRVHYFPGAMAPDPPR